MTKQPDHRRFARVLHRLRLRIRHDALSALAVRGLHSFDPVPTAVYARWLVPIADALRPFYRFFAELYARRTWRRLNPTLASLTPLPPISRGPIYIPPAFAPQLSPWLEAPPAKPPSKPAILVAPEPRRPKLGIAFDLVLPQVHQAADALVLAFAQSTLDTIRGDTAAAIQRTRERLRQGIGEGESVKELTDRLRDIYANPLKAYQIAQTETSRAQGAGQMAAGQASGVSRGLIWVASADACKRCQELDGQERLYGQPFYVDPRGGPYAVVLHNPLHPHCRCTVNELL